MIELCLRYGQRLFVDRDLCWRWNHHPPADPGPGHPVSANLHPSDVALLPSVPRCKHLLRPTQHILDPQDDVALQCDS